MCSIIITFKKGASSPGRSRALPKALDLNKQKSSSPAPCDLHPHPVIASAAEMSQFLPLLSWTGHIAGRCEVGARGEGSCESHVLSRASQPAAAAGASSALGPVRKPHGN